MPSLRDIRRRTRSVKNIAQITRTMQMVASSRMRRAQERVEQARPYAEHLRELVSRLSNVSGEDLGGETALLRERPVRRIGMIIISPSRSFSGGLPSNINRKVATTVLEEQNRLAEQGNRPEVDYVAVGRKGRDFVLRTQQTMRAEFTDFSDKPAMNDATAVAQVAVEAFLKEEVDVVYLVYAKFVNTVTQRPVALQLLPVQPPSAEGSERKTIEYIYEPDPRSIFEALLPRYVDVQVYQAMLEAKASEESARMVAMKNATDNANDLIQDLTLTYNKARQASITAQILEVVAGAGES
ncbi:MAG: ATP synthase F1 subunit gamma [Chloroflexota bacterium]|nr:ATP synthase F1 subunit gamma [Chloroflexota bacterium]